MTEKQRAEACQRIARARQAIDDLCNGRVSWRMCVPPQDDDPDLIFARALDRGEEALAAVAALELRATAAERELEAAQRAAADLAEAVAYDSKPRRPDSLSYGLSCKAAPAPADATSGGGR